MRHFCFVYHCLRTHPSTIPFSVHLGPLLCILSMFFPTQISRLGAPYICWASNNCLLSARSNSEDVIHLLRIWDVSHVVWIHPLHTLTFLWVLIRLIHSPVFFCAIRILVLYCTRKCTCTAHQSRASSVSLKYDVATTVLPFKTDHVMPVMTFIVILSVEFQRVPLRNTLLLTMTPALPPCFYFIFGLHPLCFPGRPLSHHDRETPFRCGAKPRAQLRVFRRAATAGRIGHLSGLARRHLVGLDRRQGHPFRLGPNRRRPPDSLLATARSGNSFPATVGSGSSSPR